MSGGSGYAGALGWHIPPWKEEPRPLPLPKLKPFPFHEPILHAVEISEYRLIEKLRKACSITDKDEKNKECLRIVEEWMSKKK
jgi:hypothetical protein